MKYSSSPDYNLRNKKDLDLYYFSKEKNFGDALSPYLIEKITGKSPTLVNEAADGKLVAIGSLINYEILHSRSVVWGSGTLRSSSLNDYPRLFPLTQSIPAYIDRLVNRRAIGVDVRAIRGPKTRDLLLRCGIDAPEVYGDPAILLPNYYQPRDDVEKKAPIGLIVHFTQEDCFQNVDCSALGIRPISIRRKSNAEIEEFIDEVNSCERVYSSSLHGLIVAQAYGIPAQWIQVQDAPIHSDQNHKFLDYFLGIEIEPQEPIIISANNSSLEKMCASKVEGIKIREDILEKLLAAFPQEFK